jgi:hypothetical protein
MKKKENPISEYLKKIGSKGGKTRAAKHTKEQLSAWAKLGGRPPKKVKKDR